MGRYVANAIRRLICWGFGHKKAYYYEQGEGRAWYRHCARCQKPKVFPVSPAEFHAHKKWAYEVGADFDPSDFD